MMDPAMAIEVAAMSRQRALEQATARGDSEIQGFYCGSTVCLTGGSGFMGKQMVEKLFRSCQIRKMFLLLRPKKGKEIRERLDVIFQDPVFDTLRKQQPEFEQKIVAVEGDVAEVGLGISDQDWKILSDEIDVIYHMAATTRFDEALNLATLINVRGTREVITLARACTKLKSFVHVSTSYSYATSDLIKQKVHETFYRSPIPPETLIAMAESMHVDRFNGITESMIRDWPNTYTFTKAVAEDLVRTMTDGLPICIVRPGVVIAACREPSPGWLDMSCAYGASGLLLGAGLGVMHAVLSRADSRAGFVPCDYVNNAIIAAGKAASISTGGESTKIYFVNSNQRNPITQDNLSHIIYNGRKQLVSPKSIYYIFDVVTSNKTMFLLMTWLMHYIPGYVIDFLCLLLGKERRFVKLYSKAYNMMMALSYFSLNDWVFVDKNVEDLCKNLSETDKLIFNFDITDIDWKEYLLIWSVGIRKYIVKDGLTGTESTVKKQYWMRILHYILSSVYLYCIWKVIFIVFTVISSTFSLFCSVNYCI